MVVELKGREKRAVVEAKRGLIGSRERIEDDLTGEEGRAKWMIGKIAERSKKKNV